MTTKIVSGDADDNEERTDDEDEGGMPEDEVSAIEFAIDEGLILMEDDTWVSRGEAVELLGEEATQALIAANEVQFDEWRKRQG